MVKLRPNPPLSLNQQMLGSALIPCLHSLIQLIRHGIAAVRTYGTGTQRERHQTSGLMAGGAH